MYFTISPYFIINKHKDVRVTIKEKPVPQRNQAKTHKWPIPKHPKATQGTIKQ